VIVCVETDMAKHVKLNKNTAPDIQHEVQKEICFRCQSDQYMIHEQVR